MAKNKVVNKTRRANNEGSIFKRKDGRWAGYVSMGFDEEGKPIRKIIYGKNQTEVAKKLSEVSGRLQSNSYEILEKKTFGELMKEWLLVFKKSAVSPRTFEGNIRNFKLHIEPMLGKMKVYEIDTTAIQKVINTLIDEELSNNTVKKVKFLFNQFFDYAIDNKWVQFNPTAKVKVRTKDRVQNNDKNKYKAMTPEVREKFFTALNEDESNFLKPLCVTLLFAGLRIGEVLALRWDNFDEQKKTLSIESGITQVPSFDSDGNITKRVTVVGDTKTACSVRTIPITDVVVNSLQEWKNKQSIKSIEINFDLIKSDRYIFCNDDGSVRTYSGTRKIFDRFKKRNNLNNYQIHFHTLRHTFSNMLFELNENPKAIQQLLGHRDVKTTISVYNSVNNEYVRATTDRLNESISENFTQEKSQQADELTDEELEKQLEELLRQKELRRKKKEKDFEM